MRTIIIISSLFLFQVKAQEQTKLPLPVKVNDNVSSKSIILFNSTIDGDGLKRIDSPKVLKTTLLYKRKYSFIKKHLLFSTKKEIVHLV